MTTNLTNELSPMRLAHMEFWIGALDAVVIRNLLYEPLTEQSIAAMSAEELEVLSCL